MGKTIIDLYNGNIRLLDGAYETTRKEQELRAKIERHTKELEGLVPDSAQKLMKEIEILETSCSIIEDDRAFEKGFKVGVRLVAEALVD